MGVPSMKKFLLVLLVVMTAICLAACGGSSNTSNPTGSSAQSEPSAGGSSSASKRVSIQEEVIFDQNDIKVTAKSLDPTGSIFGATVAVLIENNSSKNITVQARNSAVNGVMVDTLFSCDVTAGKKANDAITFSASDLKRAGIEVIKEIQFQLHFFNAESWDTIVDSDPIIITTDADPSFVQEYDDSGVVLLDTKGFRIVAQGLDKTSSILGTELLLYIENNTDNNVTIQVRDVSVNGFMVGTIFSCDVLAGKKAFDDITFMKSDLEKNSIKDINEVELLFHIFDANSWNTILDSEPITITFE
jgi:predicted small secreted protein